MNDEMGWNIVSVKWWLFTETCSVEFSEEQKKLRPAASFLIEYLCTFTDAIQLSNHLEYTFKPEKVLN